MPVLITEKSGERLDAYLSKTLQISRKLICNNIKKGSITIDGKIIKPSYITKINDKIMYPEDLEPEMPSIEPEAIPLSILYEDSHMIVVNKPFGLLTHPSIHQQKGTLVHALMHHTSSLSDMNGQHRMGIVHRLDKDTSGVMIVAKNNLAHHYLSNLFQCRKIKKTYLAIVDGHFKDKKALIEIPIDHFHEKACMKVSSGGKMAITEVTLIKHLSRYSYLFINLHTGRTHQIRVHLSHLGFPVHGDQIYNSSPGSAERLMLHSWKIKLVPFGMQKEKEFTVRVPDEFMHFIKSNTTET